MKLIHKPWLATVLIATVFLSACSSTDDEEDQKDYVAELPDFVEKFEVQELWSSSVGDGVEDYFSRLQPTISKEILYTASRDGIAVAYTLEQGDKLWQVDFTDLENQRSFYQSKTSARIGGGVVVGYGKAFYGTENGEIFALDANTGALLWQSTIKGEVISKPAVDSGILVVNSASGVLSAFDVETGEELWSAEQEVPPLSLRGTSGVTINSGGVLIGNANGEISVFILEQGQQGWTVEIGEASGSTELERIVDVDTTPVTFGDKIYAVSANGNLAALDLRSGRTVWKRQYSSYREINIDGNTIFATDKDGHIFAVDRLNGLEKWSNVTLTNRGVTGAVSVGQYIVVGDYEGYLHWLDKSDGSIVARYQVDSSGIYVEPIVHNKILYVQARSGELVAIATPQ